MSLQVASERELAAAAREAAAGGAESLGAQLEAERAAAAAEVAAARREAEAAAHAASTARCQGGVESSGRHRELCSHASSRRGCGVGMCCGRRRPLRWLLHDQTAQMLRVCSSTGVPLAFCCYRFEQSGRQVAGRQQVCNTSAKLWRIHPAGGMRRRWGRLRSGRRSWPPGWRGCRPRWRPPRRQVTTLQRLDSGREQCRSACLCVCRAAAALRSRAARRRQEHAHCTCAMHSVGMCSAQKPACTRSQLHTCSTAD